MCLSLILFVNSRLVFDFHQEHQTLIFQPFCVKFSKKRAGGQLDMYKFANYFANIVIVLSFFYF